MSLHGGTVQFETSKLIGVGIPSPPGGKNLISILEKISCQHFLINLQVSNGVLNIKGNNANKQSATKRYISIKL